MLLPRCPTSMNHRLHSLNSEKFVTYVTARPVPAMMRLSGFAEQIGRSVGNVTVYATNTICGSIVSDRDRSMVRRLAGCDSA